MGISVPQYAEQVTLQECWRAPRSALSLGQCTTFRQVYRDFVPLYCPLWWAAAFCSHAEGLQPSRDVRVSLVSNDGAHHGPRRLQSICWDNFTRLAAAEPPPCRPL